MFKKNDVLEIEITDQGTTGEGIGKGQGYEGEEKLCLCKTC